MTVIVPQLFQSLNAIDHVGKPCQSSPGLFDDIINKSILSRQLALQLVLLDLAAYGGELALALLIGLAQFRAEIISQVSTELAEIMRSFEGVVEGVDFKWILC